MSQRSGTLIASPAPPSPPPILPPRDAPENSAPGKTSHQQLLQFRQNPLKRQRTKKSATHDDVVNDDDRKLRLLDRLTRWMVLLYCSNFQWLDILHEVYTVALSADSFEYVTGRTKIFDNSKTYKHRTIENMEVGIIYCTYHFRCFTY